MTSPPAGCSSLNLGVKPSSAAWSSLGSSRASVLRHLRGHRALCPPALAPIRTPGLWTTLSSEHTLRSSCSFPPGQRLVLIARNDALSAAFPRQTFPRSCLEFIEPSYSPALCHLAALVTHVSPQGQKLGLLIFLVLTESAYMQNA